MEFAHALEDGLAGLLIGRHAERRIFRSELRQRDAELFLVSLRLRLDRDLDHRLREFHLFQDHRLVGIAQRVTGARFLQARQRDDIAGIGFLDVFAVVRMHQQHAADTLFLLAGRIDDAGAARQDAGIDAAEGNGTDERIIHDLEREQSQRLLVVGPADDFLAVVVDALDGGHVDRRRKIVDDGVEQRLHALVLEGRAAQHRDRRRRSAPPCGSAASASLHRAPCRRGRQRAHRHRVRRRLRASSRDIPWPCRPYRPGISMSLNFAPSASSSQTTPFMRTRSTRPLKLFSAPIGSWIAIGLAPRRSTMSCEALEEVGAGLVHLVGEDDARNPYLSP